MFDLILIAGLWVSGCVQSQSSQIQGYTIESYRFSESGDFEFSRIWHKDASCKKPFGEDLESGQVEVGEKVRSIFTSDSTYQADFKSSEGADLGAIEIKEGILKIARGLKGSGMRNSMLSLFGFKKIR
jgi:hypothetical protein